jgi:hypothetical protein
VVAGGKTAGAPVAKRKTFPDFRDLSAANPPRPICNFQKTRHIKLEEIGVSQFNFS